LNCSQFAYTLAGVLYTKANGVELPALVEVPVAAIHRVIVAFLPNATRAAAHHNFRFRQGTTETSVSVRIGTNPDCKAMAT